MPTHQRDPKLTRTADGPPCPGNAEHGPMLAIVGDRGFRCVHQDHDGRPRTHPLGAAPATKSWFAIHEVEW